MEPLRVTFHLAEPLGKGAFPTLLDGIVAYCCVEDQLAMLDDFEDTRSIHELAAHLPFAHQQISGHDVWCASALLPVGRVRGVRHIDYTSTTGPSQLRQITRKSDLYDYAKAIDQGLVRARGIEPGKVGPNALVFDTSRGLFKNLLMTYQLKFVSTLEAWCIGDRDALAGYLSGLDYIGPKRRLGHGRVSRIDVDSDPRASELWKLRPLPVERIQRTDDETDTHVEVDAPVQAPYWQHGKSVRQRAPAAIFW